MKPISIYIVGCSPALAYAREWLKEYTTDTPETATHLLLPVPSFEPGGTIKGGITPEDLLSQLKPDITVIGGNLNHPAFANYNTIDLLKDACYLAQNAAITAHCALGLILTGLPVILPGQQALVIGYGRIAKCLAPLLQDLGVAVTVAARKETDRAMAEALGFRSVVPGQWETEDYRIIVNTVPAPILDGDRCADNALLMDLASVKGISGDRVNWAKGLPGVCAPESSGTLIAQTVLRLILGKENTP